jgi:hypothetical protein
MLAMAGLLERTADSVCRIAKSRLWLQSQVLPESRLMPSTVGARGWRGLRLASTQVLQQAAVQDQRAMMQPLGKRMT